MNFEDFWPLVAKHGRVAHFYKERCEALWSRYTPDQQQAIYDSIERKINAGMFVSYRPDEAICDNVPKVPKREIISGDEYYRRYHTQTNKDGWVRTYLPEQQKTIYVKN